MGVASGASYQQRHGCRHISCLPPRAPTRLTTSDNPGAFEESSRAQLATEGMFFAIRDGVFASHGAIMPQLEKDRGACGCAETVSKTRLPTPGAKHGWVSTC